MSILKKRNVEQAQKSIRPRIKSELSKASGRTFGEDFNLEHSFSIVTSTMIAFSPSSSTTDQPVARSTYAQDYRSPSCVYLG
ncbi:MAG: hypothetical protein ABSF17_05135 [Terracidiphilus sp.]|jgi:hypothetical protein